MKKVIKLGIIGIGNMGKAIYKGLSQDTSYQFFLIDKDKKKLPFPSQNTILVSSVEEIIPLVDVVIFAVKPQDLKELWSLVKQSVKRYSPLIITIAAGIPIKFFEYDNKEKIRVIRVMPNIGAKVGYSLSFICKGRNVSNKDISIAKKIFSSIGEVIFIEERFLDKATSISGSGPGYIFYIMNIIYEKAKEFGFKDDIAKKMVLYTFLGAVNLAHITKEDFSSLVKSVCSPKGTTEKALNFWQRKRLEKIIKEGIECAYQRAKELAKIYR